MMGEAEAGFIPLEGVDEFVSSGGFADVSPDEAFTLISQALTNPSLNGRPVNLAEEGIDSGSLEQVLVDRYMDAAVGRALGEADDYARSLRAASEEDVVPALCGASGLPLQAYADAQVSRDEGDPSLMLSLYSRYLGSM